MKISFKRTIEKSWFGTFSCSASVLPVVIVSKYQHGWSVEIGWLFWFLELDWTRVARHLYELGQLNAKKHKKEED